MPMMRRITSLLLAFLLSFTMMPLFAGDIDVYAASSYWKKFNVKVSSSGLNYGTHLTWRKLTKKQRKKINGITIFRNGKAYKRLGKTASKFYDGKIKEGISYTYQLKTYKKSKKKVRMYWNKSTKKWQKKKIKGAKTKKVKKTVYKYSNASPIKSVMFTFPSGNNEGSGGSNTTDPEYVYGVHTSDGKSILEGSSAHELTRSEWIALYDDGHVEILKEDALFNEDDDELTVFDRSVSGSVHYSKDYLAAIVKGYAILKEKGFHYRLRFLHQPYTDFATIQFLETNDPNENISIQYYDSDNTNLRVGGINVMTAGISVPIIDLPDYADRGKTNRVTFFDSGEIEGEIYLGWLITKCGGYDASKPWCVKYPESSIVLDEPWYIRSKITVLDTEAAHDEWLNELVESCTNAGMTPKEKVEAICRHMEEIAVYDSTTTNEDGKQTLVALAEEFGLPNFITNRWDSYTSPYELEKIGARVGYPLRSMYDDYEYGTAEWRAVHYYAESVEDPSVRFEFCPSTSSGYISSYTMIDYDTYEFYDSY